MCRKRSRRYNRKKNKLLEYLCVGGLVMVTLIDLISNNFKMVIMVLGILLILKYYRNKQNKIQDAIKQEELFKRNSTLEQILNNFNNKPYDFEKFVADIFYHLGFETKVTPATNDMGKDIVMVKNDIRYVVEVKLYKKNNKIGRSFIQKLHSAKIDSKADEAIFVTTSDFTSTAKAYSDKHDIKLINGDKLINLIYKVLVNEEFFKKSQSSYDKEKDELQIHLEKLYS